MRETFRCQVTKDEKWSPEVNMNTLWERFAKQFLTRSKNVFRIIVVREEKLH